MASRMLLSWIRQNASSVRAPAACWRKAWRSGGAQQAADMVGAEGRPALDARKHAFPELFSRYNHDVADRKQRGKSVREDNHDRSTIARAPRRRGAPLARDHRAYRFPTGRAGLRALLVTPARHRVARRDEPRHSRCEDHGGRPFSLREQPLLSPSFRPAGSAAQRYSLRRRSARQMAGRRKSAKWPRTLRRIRLTAPTPP